MNRAITFLASSLSLLVGGLLYLCFRPESLTMFAWVKLVGLYPTVSELRMQGASIAPILPDWLIFSAPNGLWVFSFGALMVTLWGSARLSVAFIWVAALWVVGITSEVMQLFSIVSGVYDPADVIAYTIGLLGIFVFNKKGERHEQ
ncbi:MULTISPECIES: hypothetical protein [Gammaproteobacteria]|uniref:hypothetical protein n=1 Tax=Gammaproteobacteria TaxID=1236 RepID=UPI00124AE140|nr:MULTISPECIES: hypothetical protein [Gammaproteobacteria]KAA8985186.1 hypothetical protein F3089_00390 [Halospina sp. K52047b]MDM1708998.1 hypothetical protein [Thiopseudomonas alkaliphila]